MRSATVFLALVVALASTEDSKKSPVEEFNITPGNVDKRERGSWCIGERNTCDALCPDRPKENKCNLETLDYVCTCSNGTEPGLQYYDSSLYSHVCQESFRVCSEKNAGDPVELPKCKDDIQSKCGTLSISSPSNNDSDSGNDSSSDDENSSSDSSSSDDGKDDQDKEDDDDGSAGLRPTWGTAVVGAAIGTMAYFL